MTLELLEKNVFQRRKIFYAEKNLNRKFILNSFCCFYGITVLGNEKSLKLQFCPS